MPNRCFSRMIFLLRRVRSAVLIVAAVASGLSSATAADWKMAEGPLATRWAKDVSPDNALREYPRPQMVRNEWQNLNGLWDYAIRPKSDEQPAKFDGQNLVPYPVESALSGVMKRVDAPNRLWYRRAFSAPKDLGARHVLLHFGAVDWETTVWLNGKKLGEHRGGYDGFSFDITSALKADGEQELVIAVWDPNDQGTQPRGKQVAKQGGIFYTPTTGIWQTVWTEVVPAAHIESLEIVSDIDNDFVFVTPHVIGGADAAAVEIEVKGDQFAAKTTTKANVAATVKILKPKLWSPDSPFLYTLKATLNSGTTSDIVDSYFGMRKISIAKDDKGVTRIFLNNKPQFMIGPLDQGFWPEGLYTAPTDEALKYDIEMTRKLGFNMARKHVKVEPDRWYYWCDKLGLLVWQDMPSGDRSIGGGQPDIVRTKESAAQYELELKNMIDGLRNHPSIVMWVVFNEGWGQFDTARITKWTKEHDPSRLVDCASGWQDREVGDVHDIHSYPGPSTPPPEDHRAAVLGEFGGLGLPVEGHTWQSKSNWGYRSFTNSAELTEAYLAIMKNVHLQIGSPGMSAAVYTQTTDVETEVNGLMTYDRAVVKPDMEKIVAAHRRLFEPPPVIKTIAATSEKEPHEWRYTLEKPADGWEQPEFDDSAWKSGPAGFGAKGTPGAVVRTEWKTQDIWIRRAFEAPEKFHGPLVVMFHDDDAEVYLNGVLAVKAPGYAAEYQQFPIREQAQKKLHAGKNAMAVHCHQNTGGQNIDVGIVDEAPATK